jgi:hypothetical protein
LERHVSTITLFTSPGRSDEKVDRLAMRKAAEDFHPQASGRRVKDAILTQSLDGILGIAKLSVELRGPPQLDRERALLLALYQISALFSLVTSGDPRTPDGTSL